MIWLFALIGVVTVAILLWRAFGPGSRSAPPRVIAPDDDPDFLRDLDGRKPLDP
ncbi:hypothetical protein G6021_14270 [Dietzia sp. CW19]|uniref:hypothetical protein n=1 Tax=Dietzia sp. CW19 TaxID=1630634 RepID=UPI0015FDAF57|nr:hypothetical protein [Dietzia sp. CW19]MBB1052241.1 hypothetical protein [Dietzia sp. CW19]